MSGPAWVAVADDVSIKEGVPLAVYPKGLAVLVIRQHGELFAIANKCAHMACPLKAGRLDGYVITCPCHDWHFDIRDGAFLDAPELAISTYAVKEKDGKVLVRLEEARDGG